MHRLITALVALIVVISIEIATPVMGEDGPLPVNYDPLTPTALPPGLSFEDTEGRRQDFSAFAGKAVVVNFWATWCAPCVREMPQLDALAGRDPARLAVVALSQDRDRALVTGFYARLQLRNLAPYLDPAGAIARQFAVRGLPTSLLIDPQGRLVGRLEGYADWQTPEMTRLLAHLHDG